MKFFIVDASPRMGEHCFFLETIAPVKPLIRWKMCPQTDFLAFIQPVWTFLGKKFQNCIRYPISHGKGYIHVCCLTPYSLRNGHAPKKLFFTVILENTIFFEKIVI